MPKMIWPLFRTFNSPCKTQDPLKPPSDPFPAPGLATSCIFRLSESMFLASLKAQEAWSLCPLAPV